MQLKLNINKASIVLGSIVIALLLNIKLINYSIVAYTGSSDGFLSLLFLIIFIITIIARIFVTPHKVNIKWIIFALILLLWFGLTSKYSRINFMNLICYVILPSYVLTHLNYFVEKVLTYTMTTSIIFSFAVNILLNSISGVLDMDISYAVLPTMVASMIHFKYYKNKSTLVIRLLYLLNIYYAAQLFLHAMRGVMGCVIFAFILTQLIQFDQEGKMKTQIVNTKLFVFSIILCFLFLFLDETLLVLEYLFNALNLSVYFITKSIRLLNSTGLMNGRIEFWQIAWNGFSNSPILGNGFDSFNYFNGKMGYVHNIILQILYDGGLLAFVFYGYFFIKGLINVFCDRSRDTIIMFVFLFSISFIYSMLSQDMYNIVYVWIFWGFLIAQPSFKHRRIEKIKTTSIQTEKHREGKINDYKKEYC